MDRKASDEPARSERNPEIQMWIVDFDKANWCFVKDSTREEDVSRLVTRTRANDPYYPAMVPDSKIGWKIFYTFTQTYVVASRVILDRRLKVLESMGCEEKVKTAWMNRPRDVIREWVKQEKAEMGEERAKEVMEMAKREGSVEPCSTK